MLRASRRCISPSLSIFFFSSFIMRPALFYSFQVLIIVYRGHARMQHIALERETKRRRNECALPFPLGFDALFATIAIGESIMLTRSPSRICAYSNLTKCVCAVYNSDQMRFYNMFFFLRFRFFFLNVHRSISFAISLRAVNMNFYGCYCAIFMSRLCNQRTA